MVVAEVSYSALDVMSALVLENGQRWGEIAADFQIRDAEAIFSAHGPNLHFITRPRGASKTTDLAGFTVAWLAAEAPLRARGYVIASNSDQAALLIDAAAGFLASTPELDGEIVSENERIVNPHTGAWVRVLPMSDSGAWGLRNAQLLILDEFAQWPATRGAKRVWSAVNSTVQKTPQCRLVILTSAGEPSHWSYTDVFQKALADPKMWRVSETPGPVPWHRPEEHERLKRELLPSEYNRLVLNRWSESEERAISPEDYEAACEQGRPYGVAPAGVVGGGHRLRFPREGTSYIVTVDVGTRHDATVVCVAHAEQIEQGASQVVVDHLERWQGSRRHHVQIDDVRDLVVALASEYNRAAVYADPDQFMGSVQSMARRGIRAKEFAFSATSVGQIATALVQTFRNRAIRVPHSKELRDELLRVRLRESAPGVTRLDHDHDGHDDQAVAIGLACHLLLGHQGWVGAGWLKAYKEMAAKDAPVEVPAPPPRGIFGELPRVLRCSQMRIFGPEGLCANCGRPAPEHS